MRTTTASPDGRCTSFPPLVGRNARVLVLGSMPGVASLAAGQYYAHPRNAFWPIVGALFGFDPASPYAARIRALKAAGVALWDVLAACERPGSLDADIVPASETANDIPGLLAAHPRIEVVFFNGGRAQASYRRHFGDTLRIDTLRLPSTSPAHASRSIDAKLAAWRMVASRLGYA